MKIVFFNDTRQVISVLEKVINPTPYGINEVRWQDGGYSFLQNNYLILEDDIIFEEVLEEEFLRQFKEQAKFDLAKELEANRVTYMVNGTLTEKEEQYNNDKATIDTKNTIEEINLFLIERKV